MSRLSDIQQARTLYQIRDWTKLSSRKFGMHIRKERKRGKTDYISGSWVRMLAAHGEIAMSAAQLEDVRTLIANYVTLETHRDDLNVTVSRNGRMRISITSVCASCGTEFSVRAARQRRCAKCIAGK